MELILSVIGHLGRDCSIRHHENNIVAITFPVATTERYTDRHGQKHEKTSWVDCTIWRKPESIKISEYLKKGQLVKVSGRPDARGYRSKTDANIIHASLQVRVDDIKLLGRNPNVGADASSVSNQPASPEAQTDQTQNETVFTSNSQEDDLPF